MNAEEGSLTLPVYIGNRDELERDRRPDPVRKTTPLTTHGSGEETNEPREGGQMARKSSTMELKEIVRRLKMKQSIKAIKRETGKHRSVIRRVRELAEQEGWLEDDQLPSEQQLQERLPRPAAR